MQTAVAFFIVYLSILAFLQLWMLFAFEDYNMQRSPARRPGVKKNPTRETLASAKSSKPAQFFISRRPSSMEIHEYEYP
jgi:hypothetical protein